MERELIRDWKAGLESFIVGKGHTKEDLIAIIRACESTVDDTQPALNYVREQRASVRQLMDHYRAIYQSLFHEESTPQRVDEDEYETLLDTTESRKQAVKQMALALTATGAEVSDGQILEALRAQGKRLVAGNPTATVATILYGFTQRFEKVKGKRGVFRRL